MADELDRLLARLRERAPDVSLNQLEPRVWGRIDAGANRNGAPSWGLRAGVAAGALAMGLAVSGASAAKPQLDVSPFEIRTPYTPSTLLGGSR